MNKANDEIEERECPSCKVVIFFKYDIRPSCTVEK